MAASVPPTRNAPLLPAGDCWKRLLRLLLSLSLPGDEESQEVFPSQPESRSRRSSRSLLGGKLRGAGGIAEMDLNPARAPSPLLSTHPPLAASALGRGHKAASVLFSQEGRGRHRAGFQGHLLRQPLATPALAPMLGQGPKSLCICQMPAPSTER